MIHTLRILYARSPMFDKEELLDVLKARVASDLVDLERRQRDAQHAATHEESRAEHAKDTRATEQGYLARGLAERVSELRRTLAALAVLPVRNFDSDEAIAAGAIVSVSDDVEAEQQHWWIVPGAGGIELEQSGQIVRTITPVSPLAQSLLGLQVEDEGTCRSGARERRLQIHAVT